VARDRSRLFCYIRSQYAGILAHYCVSSSAIIIEVSEFRAMSSSIPETTASSPLTVLIVGGGLSGLTLAHELTALNQSTSPNGSYKHLKWHLVESQNYLGGRIKNTSSRIDMGGAWIWPFQFKMHTLIRDLDLKMIRQEEEDDGRVRIHNGAACIIDGLANRLKKEFVTLEASVTAVEKVGNIVKVTLNHSVDGPATEQRIIYTKQLIWTAPPRMALSSHITWTPPLSHSKISAQQQSNTWMSSVTKVIFGYSEKHWNVTWLRGMRRGIFEYNRFRGGEVFDLYDSSIISSSSSDDDSNIYAFTVFALVEWNRYNKNESRVSDDETIARRIFDELLSIQSSTIQSSTRIPEYTSFTVHHWSQISSISDNPFPNSVGNHPHPNPVLSQPEWKCNEDERYMIYFAGTESDLHSPGLMEGAVGSAYRVMDELRLNHK